MNEIRLKPCPFCGESNARLVTRDQDDGYVKCIDDEEQLNDKSLYAYVHCYDCDIDFSINGFETPAEVLSTWNIRTNYE